MNKSDSIKNLATALNRAQAEFTPAPLNSSNPHLRNKYADLGSIIESTKPILDKHGLSVSQMVTGVAGEIGVTTLLMHVSGEWLESAAMMPIVEQKGINPAQVAGSIISYLRRYALAACLGVYSGDDNDAQVGKVQKAEERKPIQALPKDLPEPNGKNGDGKHTPDPEWEFEAPPMTYAMAARETDSKGKLYIEYTNAELAERSQWIAKAIANAKTDEKRNELFLKRDAVATILKSRQEQPA